MFKPCRIIRVCYRDINRVLTIRAYRKTSASVTAALLAFGKAAPDTMVVNARRAVVEASMLMIILMKLGQWKQFL